MMIAGDKYSYFWRNVGGFDYLKFLYDKEYNPYEVKPTVALVSELKTALFPYIFPAYRRGLLPIGAYSTVVYRMEGIDAASRCRKTMLSSIPILARSLSMLMSGLNMLTNLKGLLQQ